jgi:thiol-disulfide isomerase/thioredoxin
LPNYGYQLASVSMNYYLGRDFKNKSNQFLFLYDSTTKAFSGNTRRYLLFMQLKKNMTLMPEFYISRMDSFLNNKKDIYSSYLLNNYSLVKKMNLNDNKELIDLKGNRISWQELLNKNTGNIIYIDFWASWCVPCRKEMPASMKLKNQLKDKKVSFIYLSIDKDAMNWKSALDEEGIDQQNSFLILNNTESNIGKRFRINSIPRYMLIDKNGKIISDNAPPPSDKTILKLIDKNL